MTTYFVDGAVGNDANAGTSKGAGNAWATIDKAMNTVVAGDIVWVKASADYTEEPVIDTKGTATSPIRFSGYTSTEGDGGQATIDGQSTRANCLDTSFNGQMHFYIFENFIMKNATGDGIEGNLGGATWRNISVTNNGATGADVVTGAWEGCEFSNNTTDGIFPTGESIFHGCVFKNNGSEGLVSTADGSITCLNCLFLSNVGDQIYKVGASIERIIVYNCTFDGDDQTTNDGLDFNSNTTEIPPVLVSNNIFYDHEVGIRSTNNHGRLMLSRNNLMNANNTNDYVNFDTFDGEVTTAPSFTNEAGEDYTLASASPARSAGYDANQQAGNSAAMDIGAYQAAAVTCDYPAVGDVQSGVTYDSGAKTGTFTVPTTAQVEKDVQYGAGGTEFTGELVGGGGPGLAIKGNMG